MPLCKGLLTTQPQKSPWIPWRSLEVPALILSRPVYNAELLFLSSAAAL